VLHIPFVPNAVDLDAVLLVDLPTATVAWGVALLGIEGNDMAVVTVRSTIIGALRTVVDCKDLPVERVSAMIVVGTTCLGRSGIDNSVM